MAQKDTLISIAVSLGRGIANGEEFYDHFDTDNWGISLPETILDSTEVKQAVEACKLSIQKINQITDELESVNDNVEGIPLLIKLSTSLKEFTVANVNLITTLKNKVENSSEVTANGKVKFANIARDFASLALETLLLNSIEDYYPYLLYVLRLVGIVEWEYVDSDPQVEESEGYVKKRLHLGRIKDLINDPKQHFKDTIGWGANDFNPLPLFNLYNEFFDQESGFTITQDGNDAKMSRGDFYVKRYSSISPPGLQFVQNFNYDESKFDRIKLSDLFGLTLSGEFDLKSKLSVNLIPTFRLEVNPAEGEIKGKLKAFIDINSDKQPYYIIGNSTDLVSLSIENITFGSTLDAKWDATSKKATIEPLFYAELKSALLKLGADNADSFVGQLLSNADIEGKFDLGLEWKPSSGLTIKGSGGLEIALPIHKNIGPLEIGTVYIALAINASGKFNFETSVSLKGSLGPLEVSIDRIGVNNKIGFDSPAIQSKFGPIDSSIDFKPPSGAGIAINAGVVSGGGYLYFDSEKEEYAGALEITIANMVSVKAIGLVTTKMPDGSKGFSLLIILTAEFNPAFQLGFGFTLNGVGGLLGLNRTVLLDPLREGVRTGAVNNIMFPTNVISNAPRIISDLKTIFPAYEGKFLIGPMAKIGWGTPTLISLSFGLIIEIPGNIAILGVLKIVLPDERASIIKLQVAFVGTIDFDKKMLTFDASLYDSSILTMSLEGDMALRIKWGENPNFLVTIGGFHPAYTPPPLALPSLRRLSITILNTSVAKIYVECYQAVTSNSVQFGAKAELKLDLKVCSISGHIAFDALFQFNPFYFIISLSATFKLKAAGVKLLSVKISMSLEGPTPWRAHGKGSVSILFFDISANFDITWGDKKTTTLPSIQILPQLLEQLQKDSQWQVTPTLGKLPLVTLRTIAEEELGLVLMPTGSLTVQQKILPLNVAISKIGSQESADLKMAKITKAKSGNVDLQLKELREDFARAQFQKMTDAEKLSKPAFEKMQNGVEISFGNNAIKSGRRIKRKISYETTIIDKEPIRFRFNLSKYGKLNSVFFKQFLNGSSVAKSLISKASLNRLQPTSVEKIEIVGDRFVIADTVKNVSVVQNLVFATEIEAQTYLQERVKTSPAEVDKMHVISYSEMNLKN